MKNSQPIVKIVSKGNGRWAATLKCGHERWFTQRQRPRRDSICCPKGCKP